MKQNQSMSKILAKFQDGRNKRKEKVDQDREWN